MDLVREDMERVGAKEGNEVDCVKWKILMRCDDPEQGKAKRRKRRIHVNKNIAQKRIFVCLCAK